MGLIERVFSLVFGNGRNVVVDTAEVFRVNSEAQDARSYTLQEAALAQFGQEFKIVHRGWFDRLMDALNRIPRPAMALGTLALFVSAMVDPIWFAARMAGIALVPEPLWWLLAAIVSFYFGARYQAKGQEFHRELAATMSAVPHVVRTVRSVEALRDGPQETDAVLSDDPGSPLAQGVNPALEDWRRSTN